MNYLRACQNSENLKGPDTDRIAQLNDKLDDKIRQSE